MYYIVAGPVSMVGSASFLAFWPRCEKTSLRGLRPGPTQTRLYSNRRWLEALNFGFMK